MLIKPAKRVIFADENIEKDFLSLPENNEIKKALRRAIEKLKENAFSGERIPKKQIPKVYIKKYNIDNLLWYPLPDGWRMVYSVITDKIEVVALILEYFSHKEYEKRFSY